MRLSCLSWIAVFVTKAFGQQSYEYDCEQSFNAANSSIYVQQFGPTACYWKFVALKEETFQITFKTFGVDPNHADCREHYVAVRDGHKEIKHCGKHRTPYTVTTSGNTITVRYWKNNNTWSAFFIDAYLTINTGFKFVFHDTPMTWSDAAAVCEQDGDYLARSYPVVPQKLKNLVRHTNRQKQKYWIGKSITPWVTLLGCVRLDNGADLNEVYRKSKYNQMLECATACTGAASFMLQINSCFCLDEEGKKRVKYVPYIECNEPCPGRSRDKCGGFNVFTLYEYYQGEIMETNGMHLCAGMKGTSYTRFQSPCNLHMGFTCQLANDSEVTFNRNIEKNKKSIGLYEAVDFCANLQHGFRMSPLPKYPNVYLGEEYWTTTARAVDWNYDSVSQRRPAFSFVSTLDSKGLYMEMLRNTSEKHGFICQHDVVSCDHHAKADDGNITSPNYPLQYSLGQVCKWHITVNDTKIIQLSIVDMDIEDGPSCIYDYLLVLENNTAGERYCGMIRDRFIFTKENAVTIVFRSDETVSGNGFRILWSAVNQNKDTEHTTTSARASGQTTLTGGAVVAVTVAAAFFVVIVAFTVCVLYRKRYSTRSVPAREESSRVHNAVYAESSLYIASSFNNEDSNAYQNVSQTGRNINLKAGASYINGSNTDKDFGENVYLTINYQNSDDNRDVNTEGGSKANLLIDSDGSASDSTESKTRKTASNFGPPSRMDISELNDIGKEYIKLERIENIGDSGHESSAAYTQYIELENIENIAYPGHESSATYTQYIELENIAYPGHESSAAYTPEYLPEMTEDGYLNADLASDVRMPHYEDIEVPEYTPSYTPVYKKH